MREEGDAIDWGELGLALDSQALSCPPTFLLMQTTLEAALARLLEHWRNVDTFSLGKRRPRRKGVAVRLL